MPGSVVAPRLHRQSAQHGPESAATSRIVPGRHHRIAGQPTTTGQITRLVKGGAGCRLKVCPRQDQSKGHDDLVPVPSPATKAQTICPARACPHRVVALRHGQQKGGQDTSAKAAPWKQGTRARTGSPIRLNPTPNMPPPRQFVADRPRLRAGRSGVWHAIQPRAGIFAPLIL